jgi:hypothetical protein
MRIRSRPFHYSGKVTVREILADVTEFGEATPTTVSVNTWNGNDTSYNDGYVDILFYMVIF